MLTLILGGARSLHTKRWAWRFVARGDSVAVYTLFPDAIPGVEVVDMYGRGIPGGLGVRRLWRQRRLEQLLEDFDPDLASRYASADVVVSMAGYNTVCELLSSAMRAVLVPRSTPVAEQLLRARLLAARGLFDVIEPGELLPDRLINGVLAALRRPPTNVPIDLDGLPRIQRRVRALLENREP